MTARADGRAAQLADGPGKLCQAFGLDRDTTASTCAATTTIGDRRRRQPPAAPVTTPRIGITKAVDLPWRFLAAARVMTRRLRPARSGRNPLTVRGGQVVAVVVGGRRPRRQAVGERQHGAPGVDVDDAVDGEAVLALEVHDERLGAVRELIVGRDVPRPQGEQLLGAPGPPRSAIAAPDRPPAAATSPPDGAVDGDARLGLDLAHGVLGGIVEEPRPPDREALHVEQRCSARPRGPSSLTVVVGSRAWRSSSSRRCVVVAAVVSVRPPSPRRTAAAGRRMATARTRHRRGRARTA